MKRKRRFGAETFCKSARADGPPNFLRFVDTLFQFLYD